MISAVKVSSSWMNFYPGSDSLRAGLDTATENRDAAFGAAWKFKFPRPCQTKSASRSSTLSVAELWFSLFLLPIC